MIIPLFITVQVSLLLFMLLHDWISVPPFNDLKAFKAARSLSKRILITAINTGTALIPLILTLLYLPAPFPLWVRTSLVLIYGFGTFGTIYEWWLPYFFGSSDKHKEAFAIYKNTHHFLPPRGDNVIPNTLHVVLHLQVWLCFIISLYLLLRGY